MADLRVFVVWVGSAQVLRRYNPADISEWLRACTGEQFRDAIIVEHPYSAGVHGVKAYNAQEWNAKYGSEQ